MSVTFTNKAALEMKNRIRSMIKDGDTSYICTFHGFCVTMLRKEISKLNYPSNFSIIDIEDMKLLLNEIYSELGISLKDTTFNKCIRDIEQRKAADGDVEMITEITLERLNKKISKATELEDKIYYRYLLLQRKNYMLDFQDLINFTLYILHNHKDVLQKWQDIMQYIQVDEFQDVSAKEYELVNLLSGKFNNLFIVGDPDQTIYEWRKANIRNILDFDKNHEDTKTIYLTENYRSTPEILDVSNSLIKHNEVRLQKDMKTFNNSRCKVIHHHARNIIDEAEWVFNRIKTLKEIGVKLSDIAIFYRTHAISRQFEEVLLTNGFPYVIYSGIAFYGRKEIKDSIAYLKMILYADDVSFLRVINVPAREIGRKRIEFLKSYAENNNCTLYKALVSNLNNDLFEKTKAKEFVDLVEKYRKAYSEFRVSHLFDKIMKESGYEELLMKEGDQERLENWNELKDSIKNAEDTAGEEVTLEEYLDKISLFQNIDKSTKENSIQMMTIHTAKGLEFPFVFVVGMNEGIFPNSKLKMNKNEMEEERRLAYVAFTRAKFELCLTESETSGREDGYKKYPSRFIFNIDRSLLDVEGELDEEFVRAALDSIGYSNKKYISKESAQKNINKCVEHHVFGKGVIKSIEENGMVYVIKFEKYKQEKYVRTDYDKLKFLDEKIEEDIQTKEEKEYSNTGSTRGVDEHFSTKSIKTIEELKENIHKEVEYNIFGKGIILELVLNGKAYKIKFYELEGEKIVNVNSEGLIVLN